MAERSNEFVLYRIIASSQNLYLRQPRYSSLVLSLERSVPAPSQTDYPGVIPFCLHAVRHFGPSAVFSLTTPRPVVFCAGSIMQCAASSLALLTAGRGIGGLGVGALRFDGRFRSSPSISNQMLT